MRQIYLWRDGKALCAIAAHEQGPPVTQPNGLPGFGGVRALVLRRDGRTLLSGGADGRVHTWDVADGQLSAERLLHTYQLTPTFANESAVGIRALGCHPGCDDFVVGTSKCDLWEVGAGAQPRCLVYGHAADLNAVAWHPARPGLLVSVSDAQRVTLWDTAERTLLRTAAVGFAARCCAISPLPAQPQQGGGQGQGGAACYHLAVGGKGGRVRILEDATLAPVAALREGAADVEDLKYSPEGKALAVCGHDQCIDLYSVAAGYVRYARCSGHSATVKHLDWSADSALLQSADAGYELLYWDASTGRQVTAPQRAYTAWASWSLPVGFPVMGVWPRGTDGTDINSLHRSHAGGACCPPLPPGVSTLSTNPLPPAPLWPAGRLVGQVPCSALDPSRSPLLSCGRRLLIPPSRSGRFAPRCCSSTSCGTGCMSCAGAVPRTVRTAVMEVLLRRVMPRVIE